MTLATLCQGMNTRLGPDGDKRNNRHCPKCVILILPGKEKNLVVEHGLLPERPQTFLFLQVTQDGKKR
jgi:hypothetical protein